MKIGDTGTPMISKNLSIKIKMVIIVSDNTIKTLKFYKFLIQLKVAHMYIRVGLVQKLPQMKMEHLSL